MINIINELYKTNLKFRSTQSGVIEILNDQFIPIATILPIQDDDNDSTSSYQFPIINPHLADYLVAKGQID